ncbi:MAG: winged helix DNA-binding protein [Rikenellaceae bacterium]
MENIAIIRDLIASAIAYEKEFEQANRISFNETLILVSLTKKRLNATEIAKVNSLRASHCSKVLSKLEKKWLIERVVDNKDKRKMYFTITKEGSMLLSRMKYTNIELPQNLKGYLDFFGESR